MFRPTEEGMITSFDSAALVGFKNLREKVLQRPAGDKKFTAASSSYTLTLPQTKKINCIVLKEDIATGQKIQSLTYSYQTKQQSPLKSCMRKRLARNVFLHSLQ
jgi:hypothetical protein